MSLTRAILGFLIAPLVPGFVFGLADLFEPSKIGMLWYLKLSAAAGYPVAVVLGVPLFVLFQRFRIVGLAPYVFAGLALGAVPFLVAMVPGLVALVMAPGGLPVNLPNSGFPAVLQFLPISCFCGGIAATVFWMIAGPWGRRAGVTKPSPEPPTAPE
jgi:hypothetical protein